MSPTRTLVVNADDFGLSPGVNRGIIEAHEFGVVTSASLMVRQPAAREAADYARRHPSLSVGLHLDLGEWAYVNDDWVARYEVIALDDRSVVRDEIDRQIQTFTSLLGRAPTHLDSHQHVHLKGLVGTELRAAADRLGAPLRRCEAGIRYVGDFYGQSDEGVPYLDAISVEGLLGVLRRLPPGVSELACHPGYGDELETTYRLERAIELQTLKDPRIAAAMGEHDIRLVSFAALRDLSERAP